MADRRIFRITKEVLGNMEMDPEPEVDNEDVEFGVPKIKRRLLGDFCSRPSILDPPIREHMKVYLRIRPFSETEIERNESQGCLDVESDFVLKTVAPKDSHYYKKASRGAGSKSITTNKYTFSHIYKEDTTQKEFFNDTMLDFVKDFIDGQNCLVFSYGVTSSGKTYTIQGEPKDAGILPRALDVLFNSISGRQWSGMDLKPDLFMGATRLTEDQVLYEQKMKERVMKMSCDDDMDVMSLLGDDASDASILTNTTASSEASVMSIGKDEHEFLEAANDRVREETKVCVEDQGQIRYSVWVSFAEIYNEQIYDLLEGVSKKKNVRRPCLKLSDDQNGSPYVKGLKYIRVTSADEAYKLLTIGQRNLKTACTKLNHNSSRSHCIFSIKVLRVMDKDTPHVARVSMLSLCDLAGSERVTKTNNTGERLKEAGNINTSLMTLGRCIETLRFNQSHKDNPRIVPFRDSKLTRLFQNFFVGQGKAAMIVNVNQCASMYDETQHVFKFSAIASQVIVKQKPVFVKPKAPVVMPSQNILARSSIMWATTPSKEKVEALPGATNLPLPEGSDDDLDESIETEDQEVFTRENIDELLAVIDQLQEDLDKEKKTKANMEASIRKEVCDEMMAQFSKIEEKCSEQFRLRDQQAEEMVEKRLQIYINAEKKKKKRDEMMTDGEDEWVSSILLHQEKVKVDERNETIKQLKEEINALKLDADHYMMKEEQWFKEKNDLEYQLKKFNQADHSDAEHQSTEDEGSKANLIENLTQQLQQSRECLLEKETEIGELNDMLTEAGETFVQREAEIEQLKELNAEYEKKLESMKEDIKKMGRVAIDSKVAMETADQSLSKQEECVTTLQAEIRGLEGTKNIDFVPESPIKPVIDSHGRPQSNIDRFRKSVSELDMFSSCVKEANTSSQKNSFHGDSSGVVADCESDDLSDDDEVQFKKPMAVLNAMARTERDSSGHQNHSSIQYSGSDSSADELSPELSFKQQAKQFSQFTFYKPLNDKRVLQVVLSPLKQKTMVKHTKSSLLRLKNSPAKDPTRGRECLKNKLIRKSLLKDNIKQTCDKRKCDSSDENSPMNTSKRRKKISDVPVKKSKAKSSRGQKYNLRTRR